MEGAKLLRPYRTDSHPVPSAFLPSFLRSFIHFFPHVSHVRYRKTKYQRIIPYSKLEKEKRRKDKHNKKKEIMWKNNSNTALCFLKIKNQSSLLGKKEKRKKKKEKNITQTTPMQIFFPSFFLTPSEYRIPGLDGL